MAKKSNKKAAGISKKKGGSKGTKKGAAPNMKKALKTAEKFWPKAKEAPIAGFRRRYE